MSGVRTARAALFKLCTSDFQPAGGEASPPWRITTTCVRSLGLSGRCYRVRPPPPPGSSQTGWRFLTGLQNLNSGRETLRGFQAAGFRSRETARKRKLAEDVSLSLSLSLLWRFIVMVGPQKKSRATRCGSDKAIK